MAGVYIYIYALYTHILAWRGKKNLIYKGKYDVDATVSEWMSRRGLRGELFNRLIYFLGSIEADDSLMENTDG